MVNCREFGASLLSSITAFVNILMEGKCSPDISPILFGGRLIALDKKSGGVRPIEIGYVWRRIASKCANHHAIAMLAEHMSPLQLEVGIRGGCEAAIHATRRFAESML